MSSPQDPIGRLRELGRREAPILGATAVDRIEQRLEAHISAPVPDRTTTLPAPGSAPRRHLRSVVAVAAAVAALLIALVSLRPDGAGLELTAANDALLLLPDGTTEQADAGDPLPDGTVLQVGPSGSALIGTTRIGPGETVRIVDGRVAPVPGGRSEDPAGQRIATRETEAATTSVPPAADATQSPDSTATTTTVARRPAGEMQPARRRPTRGSAGPDTVPPPAATSPPTTTPRTTSAPSRPTTTTTTTTTAPNRPTTTTETTTTAPPRR